MDYKQKCEQLTKFIKDLYPHMSDYCKEKTEGMLPELKESEDERIRKALIQHIKYKVSVISGWSKEELIAWLEKQGKVKHTCRNCQTFQDLHQNCPYSPIYQYTDLTDAHKHLDDETHCEFWLEKQVEQKLTDKVEPKSDLEKGKWYVCNTPRYRDFVVGKAYYCPKNGMLKPNENEMARYVARNCFHLWTIQDAKEGDVLCYRDHIFLMKYYVLFNKVISHCTYDARFILHNTIHLQKDDFSKIHPATKEQCDLLFHKIKELEYEWDAEKKELKKIENKPTWSEEDEGMLQKTLSTIRYALSIPMDKEDDPCFVGSSTISWLKSIKQRMKGE